MSEHWRAAFGAALGMGLSALVLHALMPGPHWVLVPLAGTVVILYVQPHSPVAQPWAVVGSYLLSCGVGLLCAALALPPQLGATLAVAASIWLMQRCHCIHPPGAAMALLLALDGPQGSGAPQQLAAQLGLNLAMVLLSAVLVSRYVLRRPYPYTVPAAPPTTHRTADATPMQRTGLDHADLSSAIHALDTFVDVQEDELVQIYNLAVDHAFGRHVGLTCADIMSRDVVTAHADTALEAAWNQLRLHRIQSLPVVDGLGRLVGITTVADFLRQIDDTSAAGIAVRLQGLLRRSAGAGAGAGRAEVVGQIMTAEVFSARPDTPIASLVAQMTDRGLPHIPVIDEARRVVGMVTQSDMLAALYKRIALTEASGQA